MSSKPEQDDPESFKACGIRLQALREVTGFSVQSDWARESGFGAQAWNNWECGRQRIGFDAALALVRRYNVSIDWIYRGLYGNMTRDQENRLRAKIREILGREKERERRQAC